MITTFSATLALLAVLCSSTVFVFALGRTTVMRRTILNICRQDYACLGSRNYRACGEGSTAIELVGRQWDGYRVLPALPRLRRSLACRNRPTDTDVAIRARIASIDASLPRDYAKSQHAMHAMPIMIGVLCILAIAYRYYSAFLAARGGGARRFAGYAGLEFNDGQNFHPTHKWVLFGHHFAAISGAGPLIGPVLAIQFGYLPGLIWLIVGVCLAGAVQDMLVLAASVRRGGRSLAEIARAEIGPVAGTTASLAILFVVVIALSGLGVVVVKALGGEEIKLAAGTVLEAPADHAIELTDANGRYVAHLPAQGRGSSTPAERR